MEDNKQSTAQPQIIINNVNTNTNTVSTGVCQKGKNKWVALTLLIFLGFFGGHKFYEGKAGMGMLYLFTCGLFGVGLFVDFFTLLFKPTIYFV